MLLNYKNPLHLDVVYRYLRRMEDKMIQDEPPPSLESFYSPRVADVDLLQNKVFGFFVSEIAYVTITLGYQFVAIWLTILIQIWSKWGSVVELHVPIWRHKGRLFVVQNNVCYPPVRSIYKCLEHKCTDGDLQHLCAMDSWSHISTRP